MYPIRALDEFDRHMCDSDRHVGNCMDGPRARSAMLVRVAAVMIVQKAEAARDRDVEHAEQGGCQTRLQHEGNLSGLDAKVKCTV
jgi:hypothetical protein